MYDHSNAKKDVLKKIHGVYRDSIMERIGKKKKRMMGAEVPAEEMEKESSEHPEFSMENIKKIVRDHMASGEVNDQENEMEEGEENEMEGEKDSKGGTHIHLHIGGK